MNEWADGRMKKKKKKNGKQDGDGEFYNISTKKWKKGIWKDGKRIKWISSDSINENNNNNQNQNDDDYRNDKDY